MKTRMRSLALAAIVSALGVGPAHAQSSAPAQQSQVTPAITVVAQREAVITVVAPRERSSAPATPRRHDADGDGIADAPAGRQGASARPSGKRTTAAPTKDCDEKDARNAAKPACAKNNPQYKDKAAQGQNPLHEP